MLCIEKSSPPTNFTIININATSFQLMWSLPKIPHGTINYYNVSIAMNYVTSF